MPFKFGLPSAVRGTRAAAGAAPRPAGAWPRSTAGTTASDTTAAAPVAINTPLNAFRMDRSPRETRSGRPATRGQARAALAEFISEPRFRTNFYLKSSAGVNVKRSMKAREGEERDALERRLRGHPMPTISGNRAAG